MGGNDVVIVLFYFVSRLLEGSNSIIFLLAIVSTFAIGVLPLIQKYLLRTTSPTIILLVSSLIAGISFLVLFAFSGEKRSVTTNSLFLICIGSMIYFVAQIRLLEILKKLEVGLLSVILGTSILRWFLFSFFVNKGSFLPNIISILTILVGTIAYITVTQDNGIKKGLMSVFQNKSILGAFFVVVLLTTYNIILNRYILSGNLSSTLLVYTINYLLVFIYTVIFFFTDSNTSIHRKLISKNSLLFLLLGFFSVFPIAFNSFVASADNFFLVTYKVQEFSLMVTVLGAFLLFGEKKLSRKLWIVLFIVVGNILTYLI